jgi:hypothetical protein
MATFTLTLINRIDHQIVPPEQLGQVLLGHEILDDTNLTRRIDRPESAPASPQPWRGPHIVQRVDLAIRIGLRHHVQIDQRQMPHRTSRQGSAAHEPTPPMPTTHTLAPANRAADAAPYNRVTPPKRRPMPASFDSECFIQPPRQTLRIQDQVICMQRQCCVALHRPALLRGFLQQQLPQRAKQGLLLQQPIATCHARSG